MKTYIVQRDAILHNLELLLKKAGGVPVWAVLKGNGYGLGVGPMAQLCTMAGVTRFAVTEIAEAETIRGLYPAAQVLMLRPTRDRAELEKMLDLDVIATIGSTEDAAVLSSLALQRGVVADAHVKIDSGMGRYGFQPAELNRVLDVYRCHDNVAVSGIYTHFHSAFTGPKSIREQAAKFEEVLTAIREAGIEPGMPHCCNSEAFLRCPDLAMGGVRLGSAILGRVRARSDLHRVGRCEVTVDELRWLPEGHTTGYGAAWKAKRPTRIAVLPVGWYHGFTVEFGNDIFRFRDCLRQMLGAMKHMIFGKKIYVSINGKRCPVLGHVGMLHTVVDATGIHVKTGDKALVEINPTQLRGMEIEYR